MRGYGIPPVGADDREEKPTGVTLTDDEIRAKIESGEIKKSEFTSVQVERLGIKVPIR